MDGDDVDNTAVFRMKRDLDSFLSEGRPNRRSFPRVKLSTSENDSFNSRSLSTGLSMKTLLEKERENNLKTAEIVAAKGQITRLKTKISYVETSSKRARLDVENEVEILREEKKVQLEKVNDMKMKLHFLSEKEKAAVEDLQECLENLNMMKSKHESEIISLEKCKFKLLETLKESQERVTDLEFEVQEVQSDLNTCHGELEDIKHQLYHQKDLNERMKEEPQAIQILKEQVTKAELTIRDLQNQLETHSDNIIINTANKSQLDNIPQLQKEIASLTEENTLLKCNEVNVMRLDEETDSLRKKLVRCEERVKELTTLEIDNDELRNRLKRWESCKMPGTKQQPQSPADLIKQITDLQASHIGLLEKQGNLNTSARRSEEHMREYRNKYIKTQENLDNITNDCHKQADFIKRLQRKLLLITKEREGYKRILESYEREVTVNISEPNIDKMHQLEDMIASYKRQSEVLETENNQQLEQITDLKNKLHLSRSYQSISTENTKISLDKDKILELQENVITLEMKMKKLEEENYILQTRLEQRHLQGDYDPTKTKIIHFTMNPAAKAQQDREENLDVLRNENEKLRRRVEILENTKGEVEDLTEQVEEKLQHPSPNKQVEEMRAQVQSEELKNKRLMEAFKKTSRQFREVCCQITGYKIDITRSDQYRITSVFAESATDYLLFQQTTDGSIQMLETDFSQSVQDLIDLYLVKQDSVPAFLSSLTLNLFGQQTMNLG